MKAIKVVVKNGDVIPVEPIDRAGEFDAILVLPDADPWDALVNDPRPRVDLVRAREKAEAEFKAGRADPVDPDKMP